MLPLRDGEESAFATLTERHRRELHSHCYRMLASFDEAEDAVQETFLRAWRGRHGFEGGSMFRAWLYKIATNVCLDMRRRLAATRKSPVLCRGSLAAAVSRLVARRSGSRRRPTRCGGR